MRTAPLVLLVEDDPALQDGMRARLVERFDVLAAGDYRAALRHLEGAIPDVACVDLGLPDEYGYELCEYIRRTPSLTEVRVLVTSERAFPQDMAQAEEAGANVFLKKPFALDRLSEIIEDLISGPQSRRYVRRLRSC